MYYKKFYGKILFPDITDFTLAHETQDKLIRLGKAKTSVNLLIASICINRNEELITKDRDFLDITKVSNLKVKIV